MERSVRLLNLLDPHVQLIKLLLDQVVEVVRRVEDTVDGTHEEREECETEELQDDGEDVLAGRGTRKVTVADSGNDLEDPIEREYILRRYTLTFETVLVYPRLGAVRIFAHCAGLRRSKLQPYTSHHVRYVYDDEYESCEHYQIILSLLGVLLQSTVERER